MDAGFLGFKSLDGVFAWIARSLLFVFVILFVPSVVLERRGKTAIRSISTCGPGFVAQPLAHP